MKYPQYKYFNDKGRMRYEFISIGPKGNIKKIVEYSKTHVENYFNLGFGDYIEAVDDYDDHAVTNNGDSLRVLATVAATVYDFTDEHPDAVILATGSTDVRTRLYRMGLSNNLAEISNDFIIQGYTPDKQWVNFVVGDEYIAFLVKRKY